MEWRIHEFTYSSVGRLSWGTEAKIVHPETGDCSASWYDWRALGPSLRGTFVMKVVQHVGNDSCMLLHICPTPEGTQDTQVELSCLDLELTALHSPRPGTCTLPGPRVLLICLHTSYGIWKRIE